MKEEEKKKETKAQDIPWWVKPIPACPPLKEEWYNRKIFDGRGGRVELITSPEMMEETIRCMEGQERLPKKRASP